MTELSSLSLSPREAIIASPATGYITIVLDSGSKLIVDTHDDLSVVLGNIGAVLSDKALVPALPEFLQKLDYLKLDAGNKVVYKMRK